jgi:TonB family protein
MEVAVGADGVPTRVDVIGKQSPFDEAAIAAVRQSKFTAGTLDGKPAPVRAFIWVPFMGPDRAAIPVTSLGHGVTVPAPENNVEAEFSDEARRNNLSGVVLVALWVTAEGMPVNARVVRPLGMGLDEEALKAVERYRFSPGRMDGVPVAIRITVEVNFRL